MNNTKYIEKIRDSILAIFDEMEPSLDQEQHTHIKGSFEDISTQPLHIQIQTLVEALDILQNSPSAKDMLMKNLQRDVDLQTSKEYSFIRKILEPISSVVSSDPLYVCPVDPNHYRRRIREVKESPICPQHGVVLELEN